MQYGYHSNDIKSRQIANGDCIRNTYNKFEEEYGIIQFVSVKMKGWMSNTRNTIYEGDDFFFFVKTEQTTQS